MLVLETGKGELQYPDNPSHRRRIFADDRGRLRRVSPGGEHGAARSDAATRPRVHHASDGQRVVPAWGDRVHTLDSSTAAGRRGFHDGGEPGLGAKLAGLIRRRAPAGPEHGAAARGRSPGRAGVITRNRAHHFATNYPAAAFPDLKEFAKRRTFASARVVFDGPGDGESGGFQTSKARRGKPGHQCG